MMVRQMSIKANLQRRAAIINGVRAFFAGHDFLEVDTPLRNPVLAVEAHIEPFDCEGWYLQTSPEICMKRLLASGYPRIFQLCKCFRKHERGARHLPEMNLLEWYVAQADYHDLMTHCEELFRFLTATLKQANMLIYQGNRIDLGGRWQRLSLGEAFRRYAATSLEEAVQSDSFEEILSAEVEPQLGFNRPTFIYGYPRSMGSLARPLSEDSAVVERFELYVAGIEIANAFGELTDVAEQRRRFLAEQALQKKLGHKVMPLPQRFLADLGQMPPSAGIALGLDRLVMLFCDAQSIDEVTAFTPEEL